jgi:hypothetical protein
MSKEQRLPTGISKASSTDGIGLRDNESTIRRLVDFFSIEGYSFDRTRRLKNKHETKLEQGSGAIAFSTSIFEHYPLLRDEVLLMTESERSHCFSIALAICFGVDVSNRKIRVGDLQTNDI